MSPLIVGYDKYKPKRGKRSIGKNVADLISKLRF